jgi:hypothetical protein
MSGGRDRIEALILAALVVCLVVQAIGVCWQMADRVDIESLVAKPAPGSLKQAAETLHGGGNPSIAAGVPKTL